jgi:hypothetical protein
MSFNASLTKYDLVQIPARVSTGPDMGKAGSLPTYDVVLAETGETVVSGSTGPRSAAFAALVAASVSPNAIVSYRNGSGSVSPEMTLATAS